LHFHFEQFPWAPVFKNATYVFPKIEAAHWKGIGATEAAGINRGVYADSIQPIVDSGQAVVASAPHDIGLNCKLMAAAGHTIGHSMMVFNAGQNEIIFCADVLHHPLQIFFPQLNSAFCELPDQARETRRAVLERAAERGSTLFPVHFGAPYGFTVRKQNDGFMPSFVHAGS
jgi:glyoxylase-like metal-dependent hydrolase (beta-lactamase superfamily II)